MNTLIIFLNVVAVMWVIWAVTVSGWAFVKIATQSPLSRQVNGEYTLRLGKMFLPMTWVCIAWLVTQFIILQNG